MNKVQPSPSGNISPALHREIFGDLGAGEITSDEGDSDFEEDVLEMDE